MDEEASLDVGLDWEGADDKAKPSNWPLRVRIYQTAVPALHCFLSCKASSFAHSK
jgi:hypothetical protein